ncbi:hypothetical protein LWI29_036981 [Acer saccharum]|uniref:Uncharacterized protein n=1 Tax=Acer saccharum TaxID=4024 RepID=A0AA39RKV9_ACESA|nr:hypothetical protein LWI29_036981 [Acer saccharum]
MPPLSTVAEDFLLSSTSMAKDLHSPLTAHSPTMTCAISSLESYELCRLRQLPSRAGSASSLEKRHLAFFLCHCRPSFVEDVEDKDARLKVEDKDVRLKVEDDDDDDGARKVEVDDRRTTA